MRERGAGGRGGVGAASSERVPRSLPAFSAVRGEGEGEGEGLVRPLRGARASGDMRAPWLLPLLAAGICRLGPALALPALVPCEAAARAGRWGLCTSAGAGDAAPTPLSLRGSNYIRLGGNLSSGCEGYHSTFDAGVYNRTRYLAAFKTMQKQGFNIMRAFLDERPGCGIGGDVSSTEPLDPAWLDRLAQFVSDAESHGMYSLITMVYPVNTIAIAQACRRAFWQGCLFTRAVRVGEQRLLPQRHQPRPTPAGVAGAGRLEHTLPHRARPHGLRHV